MFRHAFVLCVAVFLAMPGVLAQGNRATSVFTENIGYEGFESRIEAVGTLEAKERVELTVNVADRVTSVYFDDGERVERGQTLLSLAQREQTALVEAAEATLSEAKSLVARMRPLVSDGVVSEALFNEAERDVEVARGQLKSVQVRQADRILIVPFDGVLGFRHVSVGAYLSPGDLVTTLIDDSEMRLEFAIPARFLAQVETGLQIEATSNAFPDKTFSGQVTSIDNAIDPISRTILVRAILPNPDRLLRTGMFMEVTLKASPRNSLALPEEAIQSIGPRSYAYRVIETDEALTAQRVEFVRGQRERGYVEVLGGLSDGDEVITEGHNRVRDGAPVKRIDRSVLTSDSDLLKEKADYSPTLIDR